jgi:nitrogen fixation NifU-like protein
MTDPLAGLYQEVILDHSKRRIGFGELARIDAQHFERNPTCGDEITLQIALDENGERVESLAWRGAGCSISMASASVLSELAPGMSRDELRATIGEFRTMLRSRGEGEPNEDVLGDAVAFQGVSKYVMRVKCAMLAWVATEACLAELD